ncbi:imelysin family protein [Pseudomonas typographi]|uniref:Imelysin n=1 Tax=Pseudomonas typographi TaxID=2715964 RepID=A0ABR7YW92_9PSED|nr:imelysin family protein [Pseudomonas typographi]MBD1552525.1 imelysin [Pseudomonas typographi]MBD1585615.1 imelysin [Pseudomonas typographi]MBD1597472.1 imelysin [Pseudomonas typographi]
MLRPKLLFTSLAALALGACAPQDRQAATSAALAKGVILPGYARWADADRQLAASALAFCEGREDLTQARADLLAAQQAWAALQPLLVGPLAEGNRAWSVQFWPDKKNLVGRQVEQLLASGTPIDLDSLAKASVVIQGLSAYEYILYDSQPEVANSARKARYCPLLMAVGQRQQALAAEILASWNEHGGMLMQLSEFPNERYADAHEAIADLLRAQVTALDTLKKKLGAPMGRFSNGIPQPYQAEAWRSDASLASLRASLSAANRLWRGADGQGIKALLGKNHHDLAGRVDAAYTAALGQLQGEQGLAQLLASTEGQARLNVLYDSLNIVHRLHEGELARALGIQLGFNANDGD